MFSMNRLAFLHCVRIKVILHYHGPERVWFRLKIGVPFCLAKFYEILQSRNQRKFSPFNHRYALTVGVPLSSGGA